MIHFILLILKIIGLIFAAILGIILLFLLSALFVPICYRIKAGYHKEMSADIKVSWLFSVFCLRFCFRDEKPFVKFMVFGIPVYNSRREKKQRKVRKQRKARKKEYEIRDQGQTDVMKEPESPAPTKAPFFERAESVIHEAKERGFFCKLKDFFSKVGQIKNFIQNEENKKGIKSIWSACKRFLVYILPKKFQADVKFGTGDPCTTGQALGICSLFYGWYKDSVHIVPDFEQVVLEGKLYAVGRIRIFTLLIIGIKLLLDKDMQNLIENFKQLKEEL